jgi:hypothetical protein
MKPDIEQNFQVSTQRICCAGRGFGDYARHGRAQPLGHDVQRQIPTDAPFFTRLNENRLNQVAQRNVLGRTRGPLCIRMEQFSGHDRALLGILESQLQNTVADALENLECRRPGLQQGVSIGGHERDLLGHELEYKGFLVGEMIEHRLARDVRSLGDIIDCRPADALFGKQLGGSIEETLPDCLALTLAASNF